MKSLKDQISCKCIHFNGIMNECCKVGIKYADVRVDIPYKFPCLKTGGECSSSQFRTDEEVKKEISEIEGIGMKSLIAYGKAKLHFEKTGQRQGILECDCGGELKYTVAEINNHIWGKCFGCDISFVE